VRAAAGNGVPALPFPQPETEGLPHKERIQACDPWGILCLNGAGRKPLFWVCNKKAPVKKPVLSELMETKLFRHLETILSKAKHRQAGESEG
jgi:hypothetical protein